MSQVTVHAPFDGWAGPLDEAPDQVFSGRMLGDGLAIDPTSGTLLAPFDGVVTALPASRHAVSVRHALGVEVLVHVGLETVGLGGQGFTPQVKEGDRVSQGQALLTVDLDAVARGAVSLITPVVVTSEGATLSTRAEGAVRAGQPLFRVSTGAAETAVVGEGGEASRSVAVVLPVGLHARPAAKLGAAIKDLSADARIVAGSKEAAVRSPIALMALGVADGQTVTVSATGRDAARAVDRLVELLAGGLDEPHHSARTPAPRPIRAARDGSLTGATGSPGLAIGPAHWLRFAAVEVAELGEGYPIEAGRLDRAIAQADEELRAEGGDVMAAHRAFLEDPELRGAAEAGLLNGLSAGAAWRDACQAAAAAMRALSDPRMAERADDLLDVKRRVLLNLTGGGAKIDAPEGVIVLADELLPSQLMALAGRVAGVALKRGGATAHVSLLASGLGLPLLAAVGEGLDAIEQGAPIVLDATEGQIELTPSPARLAEARDRLEMNRLRQAAVLEAAAQPCHTADGVRIEVFANLASTLEATLAVKAGAEGCGLLRTEFLFADRAQAPDEAEQVAAYQAVADALEGRPLVIRTLDPAGDKPLAFLPTPPEANPALGLRGVRAARSRPDILDAQLRAICAVTSTAPVAVMIPMVSSVEETSWARERLDAACGRTNRPLFGLMIETPAAAVIADRLAPLVDFVSIGTNDLAQYTLAMDREHPSLTGQCDALHPAVLRLIGQTVAGARGVKWVAVCGGLASDPLAAPILVGLGVTELSAAPSAVAEIKATVRRFTMEQCQALARRALVAPTAEAVRTLAREAVAPAGDAQ